MKGKVTSAIKKSLLEFSIILLAMMFCVSSLYAGELSEDVLEANLNLENQFIEAMINQDFDGIKNCFYNSPNFFLVLGGNVYLGMEGVEECFVGEFGFFNNAFDSILLEVKKIDRWQIGNTVHAIGVAKYTLTQGEDTFYTWEVWTDARQNVQDKWVYIYDHVTLIEPPADPDNITPPMWEF